MPARWAQRRATAAFACPIMQLLPFSCGWGRAPQAQVLVESTADRADDDVHHQARDVPRLTISGVRPSVLSRLVASHRTGLVRALPPSSRCAGPSPPTAPPSLSRHPPGSRCRSTTLPVRPLSYQAHPSQALTLQPVHSSAYKPGDQVQRHMVRDERGCCPARHERYDTLHDRSG
jgi:hypothetical protein